MKPALVRPSPTLLALVLVAMVLMSGSPAAAAAPAPPPDSETGRVGSHHFVDTSVAPGGTCTYGSTEDFGYYNGLARLGVRRTVAFAFHGRTNQRIASITRIQAWDGSSWLAYKPGHWQYKIATPSKAARFSTRGIAVDSYPHHGTYGAYRAKLIMLWYGRDGKKVVGRATFYPHHYLGREGPWPDFPMDDSCGATTG